MVKCSVIIIHANREENLYRTLNGLEQQTVLPDEVIIVDMGVRYEPTEEYSFLLRSVVMNSNKGVMHLSAARNLGANHARFQTLIFLDVDCIPSERYVEDMLTAVEDTNGLVMGTPRYLIQRDIEQLPSTLLHRLSVKHPARPVVSQLTPCDDYALFWSLCFAIQVKAFKIIGGFDERYMGYGGEDTDFGFLARESNVPFYLSPSEVYHQQHPVFVPPINHLEDIIANCNLFKLKWGLWPMAHDLNSFKNLEYIDWDMNSVKPIKIKKRPTELELEEHLIPNAPYR